MAAWVFLGGDANTAANYLPASVPTGSVVLIFNDQTGASMTANSSIDTVYGALTDVSIIVGPGFGANYSIGSASFPLAPATINSLLFAGSGIGQSFIKAKTNAIARAVIASSSQKDDVVQLAGTITQLDVISGKVGFFGTPTFTNGRVKVIGSGGGAPAQVTIPSSAVVTGCEFYQEGGKVDISASPETYQLSGGECVLSGSGTMGIGTRLEQTGGTFYWDAFGTVASPSVITLAEIMGGSFRTRNERLGRTLTNCNMYADGAVDLTVGGLNVVLSNSIRCFGSSVPRFPLGSAHSVTV